MSAASLPLILFAIADAIARGGMPEPTQVNYDTEFGLRLDFDTEAAGRRWAKRCGIDVKDREYGWRSRPYADQAGGRFTTTTGYSVWHGASVTLHCRESVADEQPAAVTP